MYRMENPPDVGDKFSHLSDTSKRVIHLLQQLPGDPHKYSIDMKTVTLLALIASPYDTTRLPEAFSGLITIQRLKSHSAI